MSDSAMSTSDSGDHDSSASHNDHMNTEQSEPLTITEEEISALRDNLTANPYSYDSHVTYINVLRYKQDAVELKKARETLAGLFPLTHGTCNAMRHSKCCAMLYDAAPAIAYARQ